MEHQTKCTKYRLCAVKGLCVLMISMLASPFLIAQKSPDKKEVINITSSFKPSIVRTGKLEFYAAPVPKDTTAYQFSYLQPSLSFSTPLVGFNIRPLAFVSDSSIQDGTHGYAKLGFGNLTSPFASLGFQRVNATDRFAVNMDHLSSRGKFLDQQFSTTSLGLNYRKRFSENQAVSFFGGYARGAYRRYGFDHSQFSFSEEELRQQLNRYHAGAEYQLVAGEKANTILTPLLRVDHLASAAGFREYGLKVGLPVERLLTEKISFTVSPLLDLASLNAGSGSVSTVLFQLPIRGSYWGKALYVSAGINPYVADEQFNIIPEFLAEYRLSNTGLKVRGGIENSLSLNTYRSLTDINPFIMPISAPTAAQATTYHAGVDWLSSKGLQLRFKTGFNQYKNQALFINVPGLTEKDLAVLVESSLQAFTVEAGVDFAFSNTLAFRGAVKAFSFQQQLNHASPYGLLPLEARVGLDWKPHPSFLVRFTAFAWQGATYQTAINTTSRLKAAVDAGVNLEYRLDKKWAFWMDLNNIANTPYQRWFGYAAFGFNAIAGFRFVFNQ